jgi:hypothetical protein
LKQSVQQQSANRAAAGGKTLLRAVPKREETRKKGRKAS